MIDKSYKDKQVLTNMTVTLDHLPVVAGNHEPVKFERIRKLREAVVAHLVREPLVESVPTPILERIEAAKELPDELVDLRLEMLVDSYARPDDMIDSGELPAILVDEIHLAAETLLNQWEPTDHTTESLFALGLAADDTNDHSILERTLEIAQHHPRPDGRHATLEALELAAETDTPFREAIHELAPLRREIQSPIRSAGSLAIKGQAIDVSNASREDYDWLFVQPTVYRPNTPEYTTQAQGSRLPLRD